RGLVAAGDLAACRPGEPVRIAGRAICRQRPGTAKGFVFLSLEDESGIANIILTPDVFEQHRLLVTRARFLEIEGTLQNQDGVVHVKARTLAPFDLSFAETLPAARNFRCG
ncbi:MAG: OB-fold nucleic acid binding domain-containing protein, partial [Terracidiphilus sp.]